MNRPLVGWDLATWRITQSEPGLSANVVAIAEIAGRITPEQLHPRIENLLRNYPVLSMGVADTNPIALELLPNFSFEENVFSEDADVAELAKNLSNRKVGYGECLWRLHIVQRASKTYLICAIHHAIADGNTAMMLLQMIFDDPQSPRKTDSEQNSKPDVYEELKSGAGKIVNRLTKDPVGLANDLNQMLQSLSRVISFSNAASQRDSSANLTAKFLKIDKRQLQNVVRGNRISNHDVLVAVVISTIQKYLAASQTHRNSIIANIPVAMNINDAAANKLIVARIEFSSHEQPVSQLMQTSREKLRTWRNEPSLSLASHLINATALIPIDIITKTLKNADATVSTLVSGVSQKRLFGYEIKGVWPLVPPIGAALNFTSVAIGEYVHIGLALDTAAIKDFQAWQTVFDQTCTEVFGGRIFEQIFE